MIISFIFKTQINDQQQPPLCYHLSNLVITNILKSNQSSWDNIRIYYIITCQQSRNIEDRERKSSMDPKRLSNYIIACTSYEELVDNETNTYKGGYKE